MKQLSLREQRRMFIRFHEPGTFRPKPIDPDEIWSAYGKAESLKPDLGTFNAFIARLSAQKGKVRDELNKWKA